MTERAARRTRWSRGRVRALAWATGLATFLTGIGVLGASPMPEQTRPRTGPGRDARPRVIVRRITRRVVIVEPAESAPVTYIPAPTTSSSSSSSSSPGGSGGGSAAPPTGGS
ncbi:MAG TPA: hypothetical protein VF351_10305 [Actinomycetota bacterium]